MLNTNLFVPKEGSLTRGIKGWRTSVIRCEEACRGGITWPAYTEIFTEKSL